ncbi:MAG: hypothetical protein ACTSRZ_18670 [Promethearchaeota archaeon]
MNFLYSNEIKICSKDLLKIIKKNIQPNKKNIIIIDIDGVILNNLPRQLEILKNCEDLLLYKKLFIKIPEKSQYNYKQFYNILDSIKYDWKHDNKFFNKFLNHFLSRSFLKYDILIPNADKFIQNILKLINIQKLDLEIHLLTGRQHNPSQNDSLKEETIKKLAEFGIFVDNNNIKLVMKKNRYTPDLDFKKNYIKKLSTSKKINIVVFIDNEAKILNSAAKFLKENKLIKFNSAQYEYVPFRGYVLMNW